MIINILILIIVVIISVINIKLYIQTNKIKILKNVEQDSVDKEFEKLKKEYNILTTKKHKLEEDIKKEEEQFKSLYEQEKNRISEQINLYKQNTSYANDQYLKTLEQNYIKAEEEHDKKIKILKNQEQEYEQELSKMREALSAGVQASLREREKEDHLQFYKLNISPIDLEDITKLNALKIALHQPVILSKLIWTTYFQKQTTEMCNRIFGKESICGIYKITNLKTQQCYIGQSINVQERIKQHVKCGLGIDAPATNKLYNSMQNDGVWSFTFELMEKCPREQLNEKEKFWIEMYQSNLYGYNGTKGNN